MVDLTHPDSEGRDPEGVIQHVRATLQDLLYCDADQRRVAIAEIEAELDKYRPRDE